MTDEPEQPAASSCPACETAVPPRAHRCPKCGEPLTEQARTARSSNNLVVFILVVMGLGFGMAYFMRARQRAARPPMPPAAVTPAPVGTDAPPDSR